MKPSTQDVTEIVVNLDDVSGEVVAAASQAMLDAGALDVWTQAIFMKKQRPGVMLCVLCEASRGQELAAMLLEQTGSFGVRFRSWDRVVLEREHVSLRCSSGSFRAKVGRLDGRVVTIKPEFEDVQALAVERGQPVRVVMAEARAACQAWRDEQV